LLAKEEENSLSLDHFQGWWQSHPDILERINNIEKQKKDGSFNQELRPLPAWLLDALNTPKS
jgi:hypothetical protein